MRPSPEQDARYADAAAEHGAALQRLARATEANAERRRDLLQEYACGAVAELRFV